MFKSFRERRTKPLVLHPLLFVAYGVLSLLAVNIAQVKLDDLRVLLATVVIILILLPVLNLIFTDPQKTGLLSSVAVLLVFGYSHGSALTQDWYIGGTAVGQPMILIPAGLILFGVWAYIVFRKIANVQRAAQYFTVVGLVLLVFPVFTIGEYIYQVSSVKGQGLVYAAEEWELSSGSEAQHQAGIAPGEQRDIYYIILDAYTRQDVLLDKYDYDNTWFIEALQERGFYIAEASQANYPSTLWSLASSLNLVQLDGLPEHVASSTSIDEAWGVEDAAIEMLKQNRISYVFHELGYEVIAFDTGFEITELENVDYTLIAPELEDQAPPAQKAFELLVFRTLLGQLLGDVTQGKDHVPMQDLFNAHRLRVKFTLGNIDSFANQDGDYFIFAHVLAPHAPFVFGPNGEEIDGMQSYTLTNLEANDDEAARGYRNQLHYLNSLVLDAVDRILAQSSTPPIIILQGDHGTKMTPSTNRDDDIQGHFDAQFPILNAYYLPDADNDSLYPTISPVNSFRVVLNQYFGTELEYLPDLSYVDNLENGAYGLVDVCEEFSYCSKE